MQTPSDVNWTEQPNRRRSPISRHKSPRATRSHSQESHKYTKLIATIIVYIKHRTRVQTHEGAVLADSVSVCLALLIQRIMFF